MFTWNPPTWILKELCTNLHELKLFRWNVIFCLKEIKTARIIWFFKGKEQFCSNCSVGNKKIKNINIGISVEFESEITLFSTQTESNLES